MLHGVYTQVSWLEMNVGCYGGTRCSAGGNLDEFGGDSAVGHYGLYEVSDGAMTLALQGYKRAKTSTYTGLPHCNVGKYNSRHLNFQKKRYYFLYTL